MGLIMNQDEKLAEMTARLVRAGMEVANPPIGFIGGPDLPALSGVSMVCRDVVLLAQMDEKEEEVVEFHQFLPYGFLKVESNSRQPNSFVAIINKLDFINAWELECLKTFEPGSPTVRVNYKPWKVMPKVFPCFELLVVGSDGQTLARYYGLER